MRSWTDTRSPWGRQLRFEDAEFEAMMDELRHKSGQESSSPRRGIDVDRVLLKGLGIEADYVDLPAGLMGRTRFFEDGRVVIEVSRSLADEAAVDGVQRRRLRSTLGHECGHVACHACLFARDTETLSLFSDAESAQNNNPPFLCRAESVGRLEYKGEWWEYQANRCMVSLLLPRELVSNVARRQLANLGFESGDDCVERGGGQELVRSIADDFDVSHTAVLYRLQELGFIPMEAQGQLQLSQ